MSENSESVRYLSADDILAIPVHEKAYQLLRLLPANHPFVDGNKRTALMSVRVFDALNGLEFDHDRRIKEILKELATDETAVEADDLSDREQF